MAQLTLNMLGTFCATLDGKLVTDFESDKVRALLAYLAVEGDRPKRRETLAGLLWPDLAERDARANLRQALANLRKVLGDRDSDNPFLLVTRQTIQFNDASDTQLDVRVFRELLSATSTHNHTDLEGCEECVACLREAVKLYCGEFLEGFSLDSDLFEAWVVVQREKLHIQMLSALDHLAAYYKRRGEYQAVISFAQWQVEMEPWRESAHRQLMCAYALSGQRGMALAQYESCKRILKAELGIEPEVETTVLYNQIRQGELEGITREPPAISQIEPIPRRGIPHNLPTSLLPFVGREELLKSITSCMRTPECRLLTLVGPGGSGKTRLALEVARGLITSDNQDFFPDGLFFVPLATIGDIDGVVPAVAQAVGFSFLGEGEPQTQLLNYLKRRQLLLILDNFEHLVEDAGFIDEMLRSAPEIKVLVTSRVRLNLRPEQHIPVPGMEYPAGTVDLEEVSRHSAVRLFVQCARRVQPDFILDASNAADVVGVCKLVHGMPLGILLATAWLHMLAPGEIADEIERSLDFLEMDWQAVPARQRSMSAVFDHSWRLLSDREQDILCGLSVFRGGCTLEAAQVVTGASLRDLLGLINKSQLHRTPEGRYEMHELLRQYAAERLSQQTKNKIEIYGRYSGFYANNLARWKEELKGPGQRLAVSEISAEHANIQIAIDWMLDKAEITHLEHAIDALGEYYSMLNRSQEGVTQWQSIAKKTKAFTTQDGLRFRAQTQTWLTYMLRGIGNKKLALQIINESLSILGLSDKINDEFVEPKPSVSKADQRIWAFVYGAAGRCYYDKDLTKARWLFEQSLSLYRGIGDQWSVARLLQCLAEVMSEIGKNSVGKVERLIRESLAISQSLGDHWRVISNYQRLGDILVNTGRLEEGEHYYSLAEVTSVTIGDVISDLDIFHKNRISIRSGKFTHALSDLKAEITRNEDRIVGGRLIEGKLLLSECYRNSGLYEIGYALAMDCLEYCLKTDFMRKAANCCWQLGLNSIALGRYSEAQRWLERSNSIFQEFGVSENCKIFIGLGFAAQSLRQKQDSMIHFIQAIQLAVRQHDWEIMHHLVPGVALLLADMNQHECAIEIYALACKHPYVANSKWFADVVGKHIAKAAESLPPEVVAAAKERGRVRDIWETAEELLVELSDDTIKS